MGEEVLASLPHGENKAFRMPRSASDVCSDKVLKLKEAQKQLEDQGFKRSAVSLDDLGDLGLEVQPDDCYEVVFRFFTPLFMILFQVQEMLLGDGDSRPNSVRFDIITCPAVGKKEPATIYYRAVSYGREVLFLSFSFRSICSGFLFFLSEPLFALSRFLSLVFLQISNDDALDLLIKVIGGDLDEEVGLAEVGLADEDSDGDEGYEDAEEEVGEVSTAKTRGDQGAPLVPDEKSSLAVSKWSGILTDDVSLRFGVCTPVL